MHPLFAICALLGSTAPWTVVLDPGHGGYQPGAKGPHGSYEKQLTLEVAEATKLELLRRGHKVFMTRQADQYVSLGARSRFANAHKADVLLSIHANDAPRSADAQGIETYFLAPHASDAEAQALAEKENDDPNSDPSDSGLLGTILSDLRRTNAQIESELLAARVQGAVTRATGAKNRGVKRAPLAVLKRTEMAAVLVEIGFLTHKAEREKLRTKAYQAKLAAGIADGIERFLGDSDAPELPPPAQAPLISLSDRQTRAPAPKKTTVAVAKTGAKGKSAPSKSSKNTARKRALAKATPALKKSLAKKHKPSAVTHAAR